MSLYLTSAKPGHVFLVLSLFALGLLVATSCGPSGAARNELFFGGGDSPNEQSDLFLPKALPKEHGLNEEILESLLTRAEEGDFGNLDSLIIIKDDFIVLERYFGEQTRDKLHPIFSATKSVASVLIGIAIDQGLITDVDVPLLELFPEYEEVQNLDDRKEQITLHDALTMRPGFSASESSDANLGGEMNQNVDLIKQVLDRPMGVTPGRTFRYDNGNTLLLSGILRNVTGSSAREYAEAHLFGPLGITRFEWLEAAENLSHTSTGIALTPLDMGKLGYLFLKGGIWGEEEIISREWVEQSTHNHVPFTQYTSYGYLWWLIAHETGDGRIPKPNDIWYAGGFGGQYIFVVPLSNMVVVMTATNYENQAPVERQKNILFLSIIEATH